MPLRAPPPPGVPQPPAPKPPLAPRREKFKAVTPEGTTYTCAAPVKEKRHALSSVGGGAVKPSNEHAAAGAHGTLAAPLPAQYAPMGHTSTEPPLQNWPGGAEQGADAGEFEAVGVLVALGGAGVCELVLERDLVDVVEGHTGVLERDVVDVVEGVGELEAEGSGAMHSGATRLVGDSHA